MDSSVLSISGDFHLQTAVLRQLREAADRVGSDFMVVGALARDLLIKGMNPGSATLRATADIDIAVAVESWSELEKLTAQLTAGTNFHNFTVNHTAVDVIPFSGIESPDREIVWPNEHAMNVLGFQEAMSHAVQVELASDVQVRVASLPAQIILKFVAWQDRHHADPRDAGDLLSIVRAYGDQPYVEEVWSHDDLLEAHSFDLDLAMADLLGFRAAELLAPPERAKLTTDLSHACGLDGTLVGHTGPTDLNRTQVLLNALVQGFRRCSN